MMRLRYDIHAHTCWRHDAPAPLLAQPLTPPPPPPPGALQVLNLEDNKVADWAQVELLAGMAHLHRLHLSCNPLQEVRYPGAPPPLQQQQQQQRDQQAGQQQQQPRHAFAQLHALLLGSCQLRSWSSVDQLDLFPSLQELRISGNPLLEGAKSGGRFEVGCWGWGYWWRWGWGCPGAQPRGAVHAAV
jgi:hypothetical protein